MMDGIQGFFVFLVLFALFWFAMKWFLRRKAGMTVSLEFDPGFSIRQSGRGSARVNGVSGTRCFVLIEYAHGWLLVTKGLFAKGYLWLPKSQIEIRHVGDETFLRSKTISLESGRNRVTLFGKLADFFQAVPSKPRIGKMLIWFGIVFITVVVFCEAIYGWKSAILAFDGQTIAGQVVSTDCEQHDMFSYDFILEGNRFQGSGSASMIERPCQELRPGDPLVLYYWRLDPSINLPGNAQEHFFGDTIGILLSGAVMGCFVIYHINS